MKKAWLWLLVLVSCAPVKVLHGPAPYTDPATAITFPAQLGVLKKAAVTIFRDEPLGTSVRYIGPDYFKADIYIFHGGQTGIKEGRESAAVSGMYRQALDDIRTAGIRGYYQDIRVVEETELTFSAPDFSLPARLAHCRFQAHDQEVESYLVLTGFRGHFLKVRCTFPRDNDQGKAMFDQLIPELAAVLSR